MRSEVTMNDLRKRIDYINRSLQDLHSQERIGLDNAYRKCCLIKTDEDGTIKETIRAGMTKRELYDHLFMIEKVLWMLPDPRTAPGE